MLKAPNAEEVVPDFGAIFLTLLLVRAPTLECFGRARALLLFATGFDDGISRALVGLMAISSPNSSVHQIGALTVQVDGIELGI
jgi:hypothetical protein